MASTCLWSISALIVGSVALKAAKSTYYFYKNDYICDKHPKDAPNMERYAPGRVAEWLGRALQKLLQRFKSARDLIIGKKYQNICDKFMNLPYYCSTSFM